MTVNARRALEDCRLALRMLEDESDLARWRLHWVAAVALIRAVGHVLDKVDGSDADVKRVSQKQFKEWKKSGPQHEIFREFIEKERNHILKEYQVNVHPNEEVGILMEVDLQSAEDGSRQRVQQVFGLGENIYRPLLDSYREGDDGRDVYSEAIKWWEAQLTLIDEEVIRTKLKKG